MKRRDFILASTLASAAGPAAAAAPGSAAAARPYPNTGPRPYKRIACEEGFSTREVQTLNDQLGRGGVGLRNPTLTAPLADLGAGRIAKMDADGIDMQLLLLSAPGVQIYDKDVAVRVARNVNEEVAEACRKYPTRLAGLTTIAPQDPNEAAKELERGVRTLGMKGGFINSHTFDEYLDNPKFEPILEAMQALDTPLYIHPRDPPQGIQQFMTGPVLNGAAWAYAVEVCTHVLRMIQAGVFDRYPKLRLVIGHGGEAVPFWMSRVDNRYLNAIGSRPKPIKRLPSEYFLDHFHITSSGMNYKAPLAMTKEVLGMDRILYATDYPFEVQDEAVRLAESWELSLADKRKFFQTNAERVFGLKA